MALGGDASVATNGFWAALTMATTLKLPMLFYIEDNDLGISVGGEMQTPGADIARNLASFANLFVRNGDGTDPHEASRTAAGRGRPCARRRRSGAGATDGAATLEPLGPRQPEGLSHRRGDRGRRARDPLPRLRDYLVPSLLSADGVASRIESEVARDVAAALAAARARAAA